MKLLLCPGEAPRPRSETEYPHRGPIKGPRALTLRRCAIITGPLAAALSLAKPSGIHKRKQSSKTLASFIASNKAALPLKLQLRHQSTTYG